MINIKPIIINFLSNIAVYKIFIVFDLSRYLGLYLCSYLLYNSPSNKTNPVSTLQCQYTPHRINKTHILEYCYNVFKSNTILRVTGFEQEPRKSFYINLINVEKNPYISMTHEQINAFLTCPNTIDNFHGWIKY